MDDRERFVLAFGQKGKQVGEFEDAKDVECLADGCLLVTDMVTGRLQKFSKNNCSVTVVAPGDIKTPWAVAVAANGHLIVSLCKERCLKVLNDGEVTQTIGESMFQCPAGVACDTKGRIIACDANLDRVLIFNTDGTFLKHLGDAQKKDENFSTPRYVCVSHNGDIIVSDSGHHSVKIFDSDDQFVASFGSFGKSNGQFKSPYGVCTNLQGEIFVADHYNSRISMFTVEGKFIRHIVTSDHGLIHPQGIRIDKNLNMYITHGHLKATEVLVFKLSAKKSYDIPYNPECIEMISHV